MKAIVIVLSPGGLTFIERKDTMQSPRIPKTNAPRRTALAVTMLMLTLPLAAPLALAAAPGEGSAGLAPECTASLSAVHAYLLAHRESITLGDALLKVESDAGPPCGFSVLVPGTTTADVPAMRAFIQGLNEAAGITEPSSASEGGDDPPRRYVGIPIGPVGGGGAGAVGGVIEIATDTVPCHVAGKGTGTMTATVLGIGLGTYTAAGSWEPVVGSGGTVDEVVGSAALFSGSQTGPAGVLTIAVVPLPTLGDSTAFCIKTETTTLVQERCELVWLGIECTRRVEVTTTLTPCGASANQYVIDDSIALVTHSYKEAATPC